LNKPVDDVEEFVDLKNNYTYANDRFQALKDRVDGLTQMIAVMQDQNLNIKKDEIEL
jgi:hypothetical protein